MFSLSVAKLQDPEGLVQAACQQGGCDAGSKSQPLGALRELLELSELLRILPAG